MEKQSQNPYIDFNSWFDCVGDQNSNKCTINQLDQFKLHPIITKRQNSQLQNHQNENIFEILSLQDCIDKQLFKRRLDQLQMQQMQEQFFTSNSSSNQQNNQNSQKDHPEGKKKSGYKKQKYTKQYIYSKNYRQKKKQQFKILEQQNTYLKKKIQQLQYRLRQKQLEINRLKHHSTQKQLTIEQLNKQFLTKVTLFVQKIQKMQQKQTNQAGTIPKKVDDRYISEIFRTYDEHGFFGNKKKQILNYYFNQILEASLRDSERYLCMLCCKNKDQKLQKEMPQYKKINQAFFQIMEIDEQKKQRLQKYITFLHPLMKEIKKNCTDLYRCFKKLLQTMDKVHRFMRSSYPQNMDFAKKRMQFESWFEYHKYSKMMRTLKDEWLAFIKKEKEVQVQECRKKRKQCKKQAVTMEQDFQFQQLIDK